ncbi:MAG: NDP-hexose 2,3-dehydratase family protein [Kordiimonadaceae bacterium]|nr:NDP-hexose 2,3-dehydratase family protein [Kordiimonadaceae bacterium]
MTFSAITLEESKEWRLVDGVISHETGSYFSLSGLIATSCKHTFQDVCQPLIFQPEIGILGFLVHSDEDEKIWLMQAKAEPGNVGIVQLAPTVQATYSNYTRVHGGEKTQYLSYFDGTRQCDIHSDSLQSEQGTRFYKKFNRNTVREIDHKAGLRNPAYRWCTSAELRHALATDYQVNTDARSVITTAPWSMISTEGMPFSGGDQPFTILCKASYDADLDAGIVDRAKAILTARRRALDLKVEQCRLQEMPGWTLGPSGIDCTADIGALSVRYYTVAAPGREVINWDQPLVHSLQVGEVGLVTQLREGRLCVYLQLIHEIGLTGGVEYGPSYQSECLSPEMESFGTYLENAKKQTILSVMQSDEGGRFMLSRSRYSLYLLSEAENLPEGQNGLWVSLAELEQLCRAEGLLTNEARSCVSLLLALA